MKLIFAVTLLLVFAAAAQGVAAGLIVELSCNAATAPRRSSLRLNCAIVSPARLANFAVVSALQGARQADACCKVSKIMTLLVCLCLPPQNQQEPFFNRALGYSVLVNE
jgi:hypothetical protein